MNINTNTLLNTLMTKVDSSIKAKIEKLSVDGKIDLSTAVKEKGIQTLLQGLFKDISTGTKNKVEVVSLLENNKQSLKFKNISSDLKQILNLVKSEMKNTPELEKLTSLLKSSLIDIKNVDEKILKSSFQNSGVFLESKLAKSNESVSSNLKNMLGQLGDKLKLLQSLEKLPLQSQTKQENNSTQKEVKSQESKTSVDVPKNANIQNLLKSESLSQKLPNISSDVKVAIKNDVQNILTKIESVQQPTQKVETQLSLLKNAIQDIGNLEQKLVKHEIKNDITFNLKEVVQQVKNNLINNSFTNLNKTITLIKDQVENIKSNNITEVKSEIKSLSTKIELVNNEPKIDNKIAMVKEVIQETTKVVDKISNGNIQELLKNNISILKNISGDLKTVLLQIKEIVEVSSNNESVSKELKNSVDKILSQIDYYQLSSYSSNSNHSNVSFLQDDMEDVDIKFNNNKDEDFSCMIHLSLKEKGDLKILLQLDKKNGLNINIGVEQNEFKEMIQSVLQKLRVQINSLGLSILSLNIFDLKDESQKSQVLKVYGNNQNLDFGLDIKV